MQNDGDQEWEEERESGEKVSEQATQPNNPLEYFLLFSILFSTQQFCYKMIGL